MEKLDKRNIEDVLALTPMQEGMLFHYLKDPTSDYYFEQLSLEISGEINLDIFEKAWDFVIESNEMLRTIFRWENLENPVQIILKKHQLQLQYYDTIGEESSEKKKWVERIKSEDRKKRFDLGEVPFRVTLCKLEKSKSLMMISNHHILYDGWSNGIILKEFLQVYDAFSRQKSPTRPDKGKFKEFVKWNQDQDIEKQEKFWKDYLKGFDTQTELSIKRRKKKEITTPITGSFRVSFSRDLKDKIEDFVKSHKITLATLLYSAWGVLLQKYNNSDDVIFGTTVSGRNAKVQGIEEIAGLFINTLPLRIKTDSNEKTVDFLYRIDKGLQIREAYETTSLVKIKECSEIDNKEELFDSIVIIENYPLDISLKVENSKLSVNSYSVIERTQYDLTIGITAFDDIEVIFTYQKEMFDKDAVVRLSNHFKCILESILKNPGVEVTNFEIITTEEKNKVLHEFNKTGAHYPKNKAIHHLFEEQVERAADRMAAVFEEKQLTYRELNKKSNQLAHLLMTKGVKPDTIVGIILERSIEMIIGIMAILKADGAYLPIDPGYPEERISYMLADSGAKILLTWKEIAGLSSPEAFNNSPKGTPSFGIWNLKFGISPQQGGQLAYIIYTSGSTGRPKGVMIEHRSVVNVLFALHNQYHFLESNVYLLKTSYVFDVSVTEIFGWFLAGGRLALLEGLGERSSQMIVNAIKRYAVTHINFVPSMFNVFVEHLNHENIVECSGLRYIFLAGEAILTEPVNKFRYLNSSILLENLYGPTETTIYASGYSLSQWDGSGSIPIGQPMANMKLYILDKYGHFQTIGIPGELCIAGDGLARGYLNNPELTNSKFQRRCYPRSITKFPNKEDRPSPHSLHSPHSPIYRTGDLARWLADGNVEFLGRIDNQVKIRGFRVELGEIESQLISHPDIKEAVVIAREDKTGDKYLCAYFVPHSPGSFESNRLRIYMQEKLPDYMVPPYFVMLEEMPVTAVGKIDRKALPGHEIISGKTYAAPRNEKEKRLVKIWADVLQIEPDRIGIDDNFFELGGHSLRAIRLVSKIHKRFNVKLSLEEVFKSPTTRRLAENLREAKKEQHDSIKPSEMKEYYALSSSQERLYVLNQLDESGTAYNIWETLRFNGPIDKIKIEEIFSKLIQRHRSLRTSFKIINGKPVQLIHDNELFEIDYYRTQKKEENNIIKKFIRPFDLSRAPLWRAGLINSGEKQHILMVDMHHIIADGTSLEILVKEFGKLYKEEELPNLNLQYKDFSQWQGKHKDSQRKKDQRAYWLKEFAGEIPVLDLPIDYARPMIQGFEGRKIEFILEEKESRNLQQLRKREEATLYMVLLAVTTILLSKLSNQEDIVIGSPIANRGHVDLERIIGMFVNTLPMRNFPQGEKTFKVFLKEVKERALMAYDNKEFQFEELVDTLKLKRDASRNPLFDVMLAIPNINVDASGILESGDSPGERRDTGEEPQQDRYTTSKFDMTLTVLESKQKPAFIFTYNTALFKRETIEIFITYFKRIISSITIKSDIKLSQIEIMSKEEKRQLVYDFNDTGANFPRDKTIHRLFEEQVEKTSDHIGVVNLSHHLTYGELNNKSNRLGRLIRRKGVGPGDIAAIITNPSVEMLVGIMGVLKSGACYVPIDPVNPSGRISYILTDSETKLLLTQEGLAGNIKVFEGEITNINDGCLYEGESPADVKNNPPPRPSLHDLYIRNHRNP